MFIRHISSSDQQWTGEWVCLETGELISNAEYLDWKDSLNGKVSSDGDNRSPHQLPEIRKDTNRPLVSGFFDAEDALMRLAFDLKSDRRLFPDVNPDEIIGDSCTDMLNVGSAEHRIVPIFTELEDWQSSESMFDFFLTLSRCVEMIRIKISKGDKFAKGELERFSSILSMFVDNISPMANPQIKKHDHFATRVLLDNKAKQVVELKAVNRILRTRLIKRNRLIRLLRQRLHSSIAAEMSKSSMSPDLIIISTNDDDSDREAVDRNFFETKFRVKESANAPESTGQREEPKR